jgi:hypothetical protein
MSSVNKGQFDPLKEKGCATLLQMMERGFSKHILIYTSYLHKEIMRQGTHRK